jgi:cellulose synthase/poly-beta-1,6-N-acetylglucosamine synthase-like glycosyltransferase
LTSILHFLLASASLLTFIAVAVLFTEVVCAVTKRRAEMPDRPAAAANTDERPSLAVVMPAHDEALIIVDTLRALIPELRESDRLIVIADNCSDDTAVLAAAEGAQVVVRHDPDRRGKGYALDYGLRQLDSAPPQVVVIIDADCRIEARSLDVLASMCKCMARPIQAAYLIHPPPAAGVFTRIAAFALIVKNLVRPLGAHRLGLPCHLMGTGMAFPWTLISTAPLATRHIVEDLKLGVTLALAGTPPLFCPEASVSSFFPQSNQGLREQRIRWEHGYLDVALRDSPRLLYRGLLTRNLGLITLGLDLCVPPLALLLLLVAALWLGSALLYLVSGAVLALALSTAAALLLASSVLLSWSRYGQRVVSLGELLWAGVYALRKIPLYARFLLAKQSDWVRSKRD